MKIVEPKYEILTDISEGGIKELQQIERVARVCYKSEDKITLMVSRLRSWWAFW